MSGDDYIPYALPSIGEEEIAEVVDTLRSGWITTGPKCHRFEEAFAAYVGAPYAVSVNSATAGLHLALEASGVGEGDKVITTPFTFTATAEVIRYLGADPVFVDIDPVTLNIDPEKVNAAWEAEPQRERIKAVMPVHYGGRACDMGKILPWAKERGLAVIEDAAHALPTHCDGKMIGGFGDATVFSFYANKNITTGEGGMVTTGSKELAERMRVMRLHGIDRDSWKRHDATGRGGWYYEVVAPGFKYNMTDIAAALGIHQLAKAEAFRARREEIVRAYDVAFAGLAEKGLLTRPYERDDAFMTDRLYAEHGWHLYPAQVAANQRDQFINRLHERGIGTSVHFIPLHIQPYWREKYGYREGDFPIALRAYQESVSLPIYPAMGGRQVERVAQAVKVALGG